jgi:hypothetical protein
MPVIYKYLGENKMPPSGFSQKAINGLLMFVGSCYEDLLREIKEGKKQEGEAIKQELDNINEYLINFKL